MKIATAGAIIAATVVTTAEAKKSKTQDSKDSRDGVWGDPHAEKWSSHNSWSKDDDDWWAPSDDDWRSHDSWDKPKWSNRRSGKGGKSGSLEIRDGGGAFDCKSKTIYLDLDNIVNEEDFKNGEVRTTYTTFDAYKSSSLSGSSDGRFSFKRVEDSFSCQGSAMLGLDGNPQNQIYASTVCDPEEEDPTDEKYITPGGITGGFGDFAGATGIMEYDVSGDVGKVKFYFCLPIGLKWGSWGSSWDSWDR
jgi:hypothetical protein